MSFGGFNVNSIIFKPGTLIPDNFYPMENYITRTLLWRDHQNKNTFVLIVGDPRCSKSAFAIYECIRLAKFRKRQFDVDKQLTFDDIKKFLIWSKDAECSEFVLDETGTALSPDEFWSLQQRVMRRFVQTQGFRRNILFWVLPSIVFIQKNFRFLCKYGLEAIEQGTLIVYKIKTVQILGKGHLERVCTIHFPKPESWEESKTWDRYLELKTEWNDAKLQQDIDYMDLMTKPDEQKLLRQRNLELTVKLKEQQLARQTEPKKELPTWGR